MNIVINIQRVVIEYKFWMIKAANYIKKIMAQNKFWNISAIQISVIFLIYDLGEYHVWFIHLIYLIIYTFKIIFNIYIIYQLNNRFLKLPTILCFFFNFKVRKFIRKRDRSHSVVILPLLDNTFFFIYLFFFLCILLL